MAISLTQIDPVAPGGQTVLGQEMARLRLMT